MFSRTRHSIILPLSLAILTCIGLKAGGQVKGQVAPGLESLKAVDYTRAPGGQESEVMGYSDLHEFINNNTWPSSSTIEISMISSFLSRPVVSVSR